jgi:hypothetical protein
VTVEGKVRPDTDALGDGLDDGRLLGDIGRAQVAVGAVALMAAREVEVELQRVVAELVDHPLRLVGVRRRLGLLARVAVAVDAHLVAVVPAEELIGRQVEQPAGEVVEGDLDSRDGGNGDAAE